VLKRSASLAAAFATFAILAPSVSPAFADSAWWHLSSQSVPAVLHSGVAKDTVFALSYQASEGDIILGASESPFPTHRLVAWNASAETVQVALQELYPANRVEVSGEPGDYRIKFPGQWAGGRYAYADPSPPRTPFVIADNEFLAGPPFNFGGEPLELDREGVKEPAETALSQLSSGRPDGQIVVTATNLGDATANGESDAPITLAYKLPSGLKAVSVSGAAKMWNSVNTPLECSLSAGGASSAAACTFTGTLAPYNSVALVISVVDVGAKTGEAGEATVSGGQARGVSLRRPISAGETTPFGVETYELANENGDGTPDTQAGSRPFQQTTTVVMNQAVNDLSSDGVVRPAALPKDLHFRWPAGLIGNPTAVPQCRLVQFLEERCPPQTAVGVANVLVAQSGSLSGGPPKVTRNVELVYNLVPSPGEPARFAFKPVKPVYIDASVRSGEDYGVTVSSENITQLVGLLSAEVTVWGVPGDSSHNDIRGNGCLNANQGVPGALCEPLTTEHPSAFLSLPTACTGPLSSGVFGDSWADRKPTDQQPLLATSPLPAVDGCDALPFTPELRVVPDGKEASRPTGLNVDVHVPQGESVNPGGLAVSAPRNITVTLPEGVAVNPASADGLEACSEQLVGFQGFRELAPGFSPTTFTPKLPGSFGSEEALEPGSNFCPDASKIGTVKIKTPILPNAIEGAVYLAAQNANPFGSLIAMYIVAEDPVSGVLIKLAGQVHLSATGQIVTTFENSPQAPFEDAELHFFGGERAPLSSPARCGAYTATASLTPWSQEPGEPAHSASSTFNITSGPNGTPCPGPSLPFSPSLTAQTTNIQAGGFTPLTTTIGREDGQQNLQSVQLHMPPGLSGILSGVKLCPEAQANEGTCGPESLIGETIVSAGVGSDPVSVKGGKVYLTERYAGAPFGLSIVNPVKAGPFDLEHDTSNPAQQPSCDCVVVRAKIEVDPHTAQLTVTTDPSGPYAIPHLIDGIPVQIQKVNVLVNRPGFTFNPTNCNPTSLTGTIASDEGASSPVSVPFQVTNCGALKFTPKFTVSTSGKTSKANGATLTTKLAEPPGALGTQANITRVKVELPKQLPSRLTTLQKACTSAQFDANPAGCPSASIIGHAKVITPLLPVPLTGPAYFVSHGGEAFPSLVIVLQGYGVTVELVGTTFINKAGITSTTFKTVPDTPFNTFELTLPQGRFSALAANGNLCTSKLVMPSEFLAQNGALLKQNTPIAVTGCAKHKLTRAQKLKAALKACKKKHNKAKRAACQRQARRRYGAVKKHKKK
jgi:hypothetical protein